MIAGWKFKRELTRLTRQALGLFWYVRGSIQRRRYDARRSQSVRTTEGAQPMREEMAVFLIYQPNGLLESTLFTLSYFARQNISTVVVSNAPLKSEDRGRVLALSHLLIERPNVGYDFGGYREGVLTLLESGKHIRALYVMNDSIWFPLKGDSDIIKTCRESDADIFGLHISYMSNKRKYNRYIQSYFFRFSERILNGTLFRDYWKRLKLINHKHTVVHLHERNLVAYFLMRGYTSDGLILRESIVKYVLSMDSEEELRLILEHQCAISPKEAEYISPILRDCELVLNARRELADLITRRRIFVTLCTMHPLLLARLKVPFLKKGRTEEMPRQRAELRRLGLDRDFEPCVREEIAGWDHSSLGSCG